MVAPSTLLAMACMGCGQTLPAAQAVSASSCESQPDLKSTQQGRQAWLACISAPEMLLASAPVEPQSSAAPAPVSPTLGMNSKGTLVIHLQTRLQQLGYYTGAIDGDYGPLTQLAVLKFQRARHLPPNGTVNAKTWAELSRSPLQPATRHTAVAPATPASPASRITPFGAEPELSSTSEPNRKINPSFLPPPYFWLLGWTAIYIGGWIVIAKDLSKEFNGGQVRVSARLRYDIEDAAQRAEADEQRIVKLAAAATLQPTQTPCSHSQNQAEPKKPIQLQPDPLPQSPLGATLASVPPNEPIADASDQPLTVIAAQEGRVNFLRDLLVDLTGAESAPDPQPQVQSYSPSPDPSFPEDAEETLIATLSAAIQDGQTYSYSLLDDAAGLVVLRGTELWVVNQRLQTCMSEINWITIRRTDANGTAVDKSFKLEVREMRQSARSKLALATAP